MPLWRAVERESGSLLTYPLPLQMGHLWGVLPGTGIESSILATGIEFTVLLSSAVVGVIFMVGELVQMSIRQA